MNAVTNPTLVKNKSFLCDGEQDELLCSYCRTKNPETRNVIFEKYMPLASVIAKKYVNKGVEYDDLYQVACLGLLLAIDRFDCARGVRFSTFATPTVIGEIKKYFRDKGFIIKLPRRLYEIFRRADRIRLAHEQKNGDMFTTGELAKMLSVTDRDLADALRYTDIMNMRSLEETVYNDSDVGLSQIVGVEEDSFLLIENRDFLCESLRRLDAVEKRILFLRYYKNKTQKQIASELGISQMQVSRIERKVLGVLKRMYFK